MKAESTLDLIDVKFQDATNHVSFTSDDILGLVMPYYWGEADKMRVHNKTTFYEMFPESLPIGVSGLTDNDRDLFSAYAQVKAYFAHGGGQVEVYRPSSGFKYQRMSISASGTSEGASMDMADKQHDEESALSVALKYAGFVPQSLAIGYSNIKVKVESTTINGYNGTDQCLKISVQGVKASDNSIVDLEVFEGSTNPLANIDGESIYLENVVNSNFIDVKVFGVVNAMASAITKTCVAYTNSGANPNVVLDSDSENVIANGVLDAYKYFRDFEVSNATLVINPFMKSTIACYGEIDDAIGSLVEYRKNILGVIGYPIEMDYDYDHIEAYFVSGNGGVSANAKGNKFCIALQGREIISLFGYRYTLNCVAGYCGKMINVAKEAHTNQIASGYIYGIYGGSLKESLLSGDVIELMEKGVNSVYTSKRGNLIWGTRTMYSKQTSYFGKANVMRVCSMILKNIYPIAIETLHTDAASNPITRASVSTMLNSIIDTFISNQDLHADSYADCSDSINTDYLTKGGTILNVILMLHFIGLVERVSIKIIATDTSVTAEFV